MIKKETYFKWLLIVPFIFIAVNGCKKKEEPTPTPSANVLPVSDNISFTTYLNQTGNPNVDGLQSHIVNSTKNYTINLYGAFNQDNSPKMVKTVTFQKQGNDTTICMTIDTATNKLATAYAMVNNVKQPYLIKHTYNSDNSMDILIYDYDWTTNTGILKYEARYESSNGHNSGTVLYSRSPQGGDWALSIATGFAFAEATFYGTGVGLLGAGASALIPVAGTVFLVGLAVGAVVAVLPSNANASEYIPQSTPYPTTTPATSITNPVTSPNSNLPASPCSGINISFNESMDQNGSIAIFNIAGGAVPYQYAIGSSAFQSNSVFNGPYPSGTYTIIAKDNNGCALSKTVQLPSTCGPVTDIDGNVYQVVTIGNQCWMAENLRVTKYRNGDPIATGISNNTTWSNLTNGAYCNYNDSADNATMYGRLYNWYAFNDSRGIAPEGWHIPTVEEWTTLQNYLGGSTLAGDKLKASSSYSPSWNGSNTSGFNGLPAGERDTQGTFYGLGSGSNGLTGFWSDPGTSGTEASFFSLTTSSTHCINGYNFKSIGLSIRCVKD